MYGRFLSVASTYLGGQMTFHVWTLVWEDEPKPAHHPGCDEGVVAYGMIRSSVCRSFAGRMERRPYRWWDPDGASVVSGIRYLGNEEDALEAHMAGLLTEIEWQVVYRDSAFEDLIAALQKIPTKVIAEATGYNPRTVRRLKCRGFRPSERRLEELIRLTLAFG